MFDCLSLSLNSLTETTVVLIPQFQCVRNVKTLGVVHAQICDIRPECEKCNLYRIRIFSSEPSGLMIIKN